MEEYFESFNRPKAIIILTALIFLIYITATSRPLVLRDSLAQDQNHSTVVAVNVNAK